MGVLYILKGFISIYVNFFFRGGYLFYIHVFILGEGGSCSDTMVSNCFLFGFLMYMVGGHGTVDFWVYLFVIYSFTHSFTFIHAFIYTIHSLLHRIHSFIYTSSFSCISLLLHFSFLSSTHLSSSFSLQFIISAPASTFTYCRFGATFLLYGGINVPFLYRPFSLQHLLHVALLCACLIIAA